MSAGHPPAVRNDQQWQCQVPDARPSRFLDVPRNRDPRHAELVLAGKAGTIPAFQKPNEPVSSGLPAFMVLWCFDPSVEQIAETHFGRGRRLKRLMGWMRPAITAWRLGDYLGDYLEEC